MGFLDKLLGRAKKTAGEVAEKTAPLVDKAQDAAGGAWDKTKDVAAEAKEKLADVRDKAGDAGSGAADEAKDALQDAPEPDRPSAA